MLKFVIESLECRLLFSVLYVDATAPSVDADGTSWRHALRSLQQALLTAASGDEVRVAQGIYKPFSADDQSASFELKSGVTLRGGYAGRSGVDPNARDWFDTASILSGDLGVAGDTSDNSYHVVAARMADGNGVLDGFTITAGNANAAGSTYVAGGGIVIDQASPTILNCTITRNIAKVGGGIYAVGVYNDRAAPTFINCSFTGNRASIGGDVTQPGGGAIYDYFADTTLVNCTFVGNVGWRGGAIYDSFSSLNIANCTITANQSDSWGGGMYVEQTYGMSMSNSILYGNQGFGVGSQYFADTHAGQSVAYSDFQGISPSGGNISQPPMFSRAPAIGADNAWGTADDDYGNLRLQAASPCVDAASNAGVPAGITGDLEQSARIVDTPGVRDPGSIADMGAYERGASFAVTGGQFDYDRAVPALAFFLNGAAATSSIGVSDVVVRRILPGGVLGEVISIDGWSYDADSRTVEFVPCGRVGDGDYAATLLSGAISDSYGNSTSADFRFDFFSLAGDANHDRTVDTVDFSILASNFSKTGMKFSDGDFNYDTSVDTIDFSILAANFSTSILTPGAYPLRPEAYPLGPTPALRDSSFSGVSGESRVGQALTPVESLLS